MTRPTKITVNEAKDIIQRNVKGTMALTIDLNSPMDTKMNKTGNPYIGLGLVEKLTLNGIVGHIYYNSVNRQAGREGKETREIKQHPWGDMDKNHLFRIHRKTEQIYIPMQIRSAKVHGYFLPDGTQIPEENIKPFKKAKYKSSTQEDLEKEVIVKDLKLENITGLRFKSASYEIVPEEHPEIQVETIEREQSIAKETETTN